MRGLFEITYQGKNWPARNYVPDEGERDYLKILFQGDNSIVSAGGNFYIGLCANIIDETATLGDLTEPSDGINGYSRIAVERNTTGWPTIDQVNGIYRAVSKQITFTPSGGNFDQAIQRLFITNVINGTLGPLLALSSLIFDTPTILTPSTPLAVQYNFFLD